MAKYGAILKKKMLCSKTKQEYTDPKHTARATMERYKQIYVNL